MTNKNEIIVAVALIFNEQGEILLQKRRDEEFPSEDGRWELPGGGVEEGETLEEALQRECKEEIGAGVAILSKIDWISKNSHINKDGKEINFVVHCFLCRPGEGQIEPSNGEVAEIRWFKESETTNLKMIENNRRFIKLAQEL